MRSVLSGSGGLLAFFSIIGGTAPEWLMATAIGEEHLAVIREELTAERCRLFLLGLFVTGVSLFVISIGVISYRRLARRYYLDPYSVDQAY